VIEYSEDKEIGEIVRKSILKVMVNDAYYGYMILYIPVYIKNTGMGGTIYTDGVGIYFDTEDMSVLKETLKKTEPYKILEHEMSHIMLNHINRETTFKKMIEDCGNGNVLLAQEYVINNPLGITTDGIVNWDLLQNTFKFDYSQKDEIDRESFEELAIRMGKIKKLNIIPGLIFKDGKNGRPGGGWGNPQTHTKANPANESDKAKQKAKMRESGFKSEADYIKEAMKRAIMKNIGKEKTGIFKTLDLSDFNPEVNWKKVLYNEIKQFKINEDADEGHKYLNRRYHQMSRMMPRFPLIFNKKKFSYDGVFVAIDTSGSIDDDEYKKQIGETLSLIQNERIKGKIFLFDTEIKHEIKVDSNSNPKDVLNKLKSRSYGGTDLNCVFNKSAKEKAKLLLVLSDMYATYPEKTKWNFRVICLTRTDEKETIETAKKYGKVIIFKK
jgi:predicted metal-dependent peptidase